MPDARWSEIITLFQVLDPPLDGAGRPRGQGRSPGCQDAGLIERAAADWLFSTENHRSGAVAQNGLGWGGAGLTELSNQREPIFRIRRQRPMLWAAANNFQATPHCV